MARRRDLQLDVLVNALDRGLGAVAAQIELVAARLEALDRKVARPRVEVDTDDAERNIGRFASDLEKRIGRAVKALPKIELTSDTDPLARQLQTLRAQLVQLSRQRIGIDIDADSAFAQIQRIRAQLTALSGNSGANIQVRTDAAAALAELAAVKAAAESVDSADVDLEIKGGKSLRDWINGVSLLTRSLRTLVMPVAFLGALPTIVTMAGALGELTGVVGLLPGLLLGVGSAIGAVVLGFQGFGDAVSAAKPEDLAEALKLLAPNAQSAALAVRGLGDAWKTVGAAVQQSLFANVADDIQRIGTSYIPVLRTGLSGVASALNTGAQSWAEWAAGAEATRDLGRIFEGARAGVDQLAPGVRDVAAALTDIGVVSTGMFPRLASGISGAAGQFRDFIAQARETGQLEMWIQRGVDAVGSLTRSVGNIISTFGGLSDAAELAVGGTFLSKLESATQRMDEFVNSVDGQTRVLSFFETIQGAVESILPGLGSLGSSALDAFGVAGPGAQMFATAISDIVTSLAPALPLIASLTSVVGVLATGFAGLLGALGPIPAIALGVYAAFRLLGTVGSLIGSALLLVSTGLTRVATTAGAAVLGLTGSAAAGQLVATTMGRVATAFSTTAAFLAGPWGAALLVAAGALTYFATQGAAEAEARLAAVRAEAQSLQSTLDQLTGGITDATVAQRAHNLAMDNFNETGRSTLQVAQDFGLAANTVTQATLGNVDSLRTVNTALTDHAQRVVESSAGYQELAPVLTQAGLTARDVAVAFLAGGDAQKAMMDRLTALVPVGSRAALALGEMSAQINTGVESARVFAEHIGATNAALANVIDQTILAAAGAVDMGASMQAAGSAIEQFRGALDRSNGSIIQGAEGAQQLSTSLQAVANDANVTAVAAGIAAGASGNLAAGVAAAGESMKQSRQAFIEMAVAAGLGATEARLLADSLGLIPLVAETRYLLRGAPEATQQIGEIIALMQALPAQKSFVVDALTEEAIAKLRALGATVEQLEDGTFRVTIEGDAEVRQKINSLMALGLSLSEAIELTVGLDDTEFNAKLQELQKKLDSLKKPPMAGPISFDTGEADGQLDALEQRLQNFGNTTIPMPQFEPDTGGKTLQASFGSAFDSLDPVKVPVEADTGTFVTGADLLALIGALLVPVDADTAPATGKFDALLALLRALVVPPIPVDANTASAQAKVDALLAALLALVVPPIPVPLDTSGAQTGLNGLLDQLNGLRTQPPIPVPLDTSGADTRMASLRTSIDGLRTMPPIPLNLDSLAASTAVSNLRAAIDAIRNLGAIPLNLDTAAASAAVAALRAAILALNGLNTTARHTQTDNVAQVAALIRTLNSINTTARHTQTDNVADVLAAIRTLNSANTTSTHTVSHNVSSVLSALNSLNGHNTSSTHTVTTVYKTVGAPSARAAGGAVVRMARGGVLPGYRPGVDSIPALLSPGESVLTPEATRLLGAKAVMGLNKMASGRKGAVLGRGSLPSSGGSLSGGSITGFGGNTLAVERKIDELITVMRARDGVTVNVTGSPVGDPAETAQAAKLALRTV